MLKFIDINDVYEWNTFLEKINNHDIYYTREYMKPYCEQENAQIKLLYYKKGDFILYYPVLIKDIESDSIFANKIPSKTFFDIETPYGYGGPIANHYDNNKMQCFKQELCEWAKDNNIVSHFFRFHPLLENHIICKDIVELKTFKQTVYIDLESEEVIYKFMSDKCRNMVKKAVKNGCRIEINNSKSNQQAFGELYKGTMERNHANKYYYFNDSFFDALYQNLGKTMNLFSVIYDEKIISSAIIMEDNYFLHYHLSAADRNYMNLAGNNLLLYEVAKYGCKKGLKKFHLGGGIIADDGLFNFKKSFNRNGLKDFYIGKIIFDSEKFKYLVELRKESDKEFDVNNNKMITYRA